MSFENVPKEKLNEVKPKLNEVLKALADAGDIDLERIQSIINRQKLKNLSKLEEYPHSAIADLIIGHMLYGNTKEDVKIYSSKVKTQSYEYILVAGSNESFR